MEIQNEATEDIVEKAPFILWISYPEGSDFLSTSFLPIFESKIQTQDPSSMDLSRRLLLIGCLLRVSYLVIEL